MVPRTVALQKLFVFHQMGGESRNTCTKIQTATTITGTSFCFFFFNDRREKNIKVNIFAQYAYILEDNASEKSSVLREDRFNIDG